MSRPFFEQGEPPTETMGPCEGATIAGGQATLSLQHLHSLLTTLAPLRAAYASAAVDRLRALPTESRRALLPHVLEEHPDLASEPRVRVLAHDLGIEADAPSVSRWLADLSGVPSASATQALARIERAITFFAEVVADVAREVPEVDDLPDGPAAVLAWALDADQARLDAVRRAFVAAAIDEKETLAMARDLAATRDAEDDLGAVERRAKIPRWWPAPFHDAACWAQAKRERATRPSFDAALTSRLRALRERG